MASCRTCRWLGFAIRFSRGSQAVRRRLYHIPRRRGLPFDLTREGKVCGQGFFRGISQVSKEMKKEKGEGGNKKLTPSKESEEEEGCLDRAERRDAHLFLFRYTLSTTPILLTGAEEEEEQEEPLSTLFCLLCNPISPLAASYFIFLFWRSLSAISFSSSMNSLSTFVFRFFLLFF